MTMFTRMSEKGQVVVPKAMRERKGWPAGTDLEVIDAGEGVMLRPRSVARKISVQEAVARFRKIYTHEGPPVPIEKLSWSSEVEDTDP